MTMNKINQKVKQLILEYDTADPYEICDKLGVIVTYQNLPESVNGFTVKMNGIQFIVINDVLNLSEKRLTTAHELGHILLHNGTNSIELSINTSFCVSKYEREADLFAVFLLMYAESSEFDGLECITAEDISNIIHMPKNRLYDILD